MDTQRIPGRILFLLLLSCSIRGQSQQSSPPKFLPNFFSTIQATLGGLNRFAFVPRPGAVGPFPATGYLPGEVNIAYSHPFVQGIPQQPAVQFSGPARIRQNVLLPTPPAVRDEAAQLLHPKRSSDSDNAFAAQKRPASPPPLMHDNRRFQDVKFIQPSSVVPSENTRKEIQLKKFHKPVRVDVPFGTDSTRNSVTAPVSALSNFDYATVANQNPFSSFASGTRIANAQRYNASNHRVQTTRTSPQIKKERRPFNNFRPITTRTKPFPREKPGLPQIIVNNNQTLEVTNDDQVKFQNEEITSDFPIGESNTSLMLSASESHVVYAKMPQEPVKVLNVLEEKETYSVLNESSSIYSENFTEGTGSASDTTELIFNETVHETSSTETAYELPLASKNDHPATGNSPHTTKSVTTASEVDRFQKTPTGSWTPGDNKVLTGTPEEILELKLADAVNNFGFELYHKLEQTHNVFFSPFSVAAAVAIVLEGTSNMTALQIMSTLHFSESNIRPDEVKTGFKRLMKSLKSKRSDYQFENANLLLLQNKFFFKSEFSNIVYKHYKPLLGSVDFAVNGLNIKRNVNDWVKRRTHGKIAEFLTDPLPPETVFAVLNAVYFRGQWIQPFDPVLTRTTLFYNYGKDPVDITMMKQIGTFPVGYSVSLNAQVIELLYEGEEISMVILLPEERDGIYKLRNQLNYQELYVILNTLDFHLVQVSLPRFSLRSKYNFEDVLKGMGMKDVFIPGKANFGRLTNVTGLYLSKVSHEGVIDVDEKGTEAAASTGTFVVPLSRPREVVINHPFFFFIRNRNNGAILFIGQFDAFHV